MEQTLHKIAAIENLIFIGAASLDLKLDHKRYTEWLSNGKNAGMKYLEENVEVRSNPNLLLAQTKSVLVFGMPYYQGDKWTRPGFKTPRIAMYARLKDYHKLIKKKLDLIVDKLCASNESWRRSDFRVAVDTLPLLERALANNTKTGFIGKNTCYIHPRKGSFLLLGEILSTHDFSHHSVKDSDQIIPIAPTKLVPGCGTCKRCQVHCPTNALSQDYQIDANLCLSYWTIENRETIPEKFWYWIKDYIFGCDICQLVCPWNRNKPVEPFLDGLKRIPQETDAYDIATMTQSRYEELFSATPATRAKRTGLQRNALISLLMRRDPRLLSAIDTCKAEAIPMILATIDQIERHSDFMTIKNLPR